MLGIPYRETNIEANSRNSVPNHSAEEKTTQNSVPWNKNRSKLKHFTEENMLSILLFWLFCKTNFCSRNSLRFTASEWTLPWTSEGLRKSTFFRCIQETVPSLFRRIFSELNAVANPSCDHSRRCPPVGRPAYNGSPEMGKHPDLLVAHPTSTIFTTIGRNYEIS